MTGFDPLPFAIPLFVLLIVVELFWARRTGRRSAYETRDTAVSLGLGLGSVVAGGLAAPAVLAIMAQVHDASPLRIGWTWWAWPL